MQATEEKYTKKTQDQGTHIPSSVSPERSSTLSLQTSSLNQDSSEK